MDAKTRESGEIVWKLERARIFSSEFLSRLMVLFKLRVVALLVLSSLGGALLASRGNLMFGQICLLLITGTLSSAGASASRIVAMSFCEPRSWTRVLSS